MGWSQVKYIVEEDSIEVDVPKGQDVAFGLVDYTCWAQYPIKNPPPMDEDEINELWEWDIDEVIPCLEDHGYTVTGFPSRESFVDGYFANRTFPGPHELVDAPEELREICPSRPEHLK